MEKACIERRRARGEKATEKALVALAGGALTHFFFFGYLEWDANLCFVIAGLVGWGGSKAVDGLGKYVAKKTGLDDPEGD